MLRHLSLLCGLTLVVTVSVAFGIRSERHQGYAAQVYEALGLAWREAQAATGSPPWLLYTALHEGEGVTRGADIDDGALVLLAGFLPRTGGEGG